MPEVRPAQPVVNRVGLTFEQRRIQLLVRNLLATLDAVVPHSTIDSAVEGVRRSLQALSEKVATVTTVAPSTWTFCGHWENDTIVVDYVLPGEVWDDREDEEGRWPEGLWAASGSGRTVEEARAAALGEYLDEEGYPRG